MTFTQSIKTCFSKYATFKGRASRSEYWWWTLFNILLGILIGVILGLSGASEDTVDIVSSIFALLMLLPNIAVSVRRIHDSGRSGWWWWIILVPLAGPIFFLFLLVAKSQEGDNKYGEYPN